MAFLDFHFFSETLGLACSAHILIPQQRTLQIGMAGGVRRDKYPTLYLLHGLSDDHTTWMRRTSIERYAAAKNIAVVMPAAGRSFYQDMASGALYWSFLRDELPEICRRFFPLSAERTDNFAAGLSMGGYGALRLGLSMPDKFAAVASLSGALDLARRLREAGRKGSLIGKTEWAAMFGPDVSAPAPDEDLWQLAQALAFSGAPRPEIYLCCGLEDSLLPETRAFRDHLGTIGLRATCDESPGAHDWSYWDAQIQRVLDWLPLGPET